MNFSAGRVSVTVGIFERIDFAAFESLCQVQVVSSRVDDQIGVVWSDVTRRRFRSAWL